MEARLAAAPPCKQVLRLEAHAAEGLAAEEVQLEALHLDQTIQLAL